MAVRRTHSRVACAQRPVVAGLMLLASIPLIACRTAEGDSIPPHFPGVYEYDAAVAPLAPWSFHVALELHRDGRYEMVTDSDIDGDRDRDTRPRAVHFRDGAVLLSHDGRRSRQCGRSATASTFVAIRCGPTCRDLRTRHCASRAQSKPILVRLDRIGD